MGEPKLKDRHDVELKVDESTAAAELDSQPQSGIGQSPQSREAFLKIDPKYEQLVRKRQKQAFRITLLMAFLSILTIYSDLGRMIEESVSAPIDFRVRSFFTLEPKVSPKLKVLAIDDAAVNYFKKTSLSLTEWAKILLYIDSHHPKVIYIDKIFGIGYGNNPDDTAALEELKKLKAPVFIGSFISQSKNSYRDQLPDILPGNQIKNVKSTDKDYSYIFDLRQKKYTAYGPEKKLLDVFQIAHINFASTLSFSPILRLNDSQLLFYLGIVGEDIELKEDFINVGKTKAPLSDDKILINFLNYKKNFSSVAKSLTGLEKRRSQGELWDDFLKEEDHVLILPEAFTGSADFKQSPLGSILGGWYIASVINSALTGEWLTRLDSVFALILSIFAMGLFATYARERLIWTTVIGIVVLIPICGITLFCVSSTVTPWLLTALFLAATGMSVLAVRAQMDKEKEKILESMLIESSMAKKDNEDFSRKTKAFEREKNEAAAIASAFLPDPLPNWPHMGINGFHRFIDAASGDWFFFEKSDDHKLFHVILCDITGHGVQAAIIVSTCKTVLNSFRKYQPESKNSLGFITDYIETLNEILFMQGHGHHTCTLVAATLEPESGLIHLVTCGHPPALLIKNDHQNKRPETLKTRYNPLGCQKDLPVEPKTFSWEIGDELILHTDGIPLGENLRSVSRYFKDNQERSSQFCEKLFDFIREKMNAKGKKVQDDDISLIILKRTDQ